MSASSEPINEPEPMLPHAVSREDVESVQQIVPPAQAVSRRVFLGREASVAAARSPRGKRTIGWIVLLIVLVIAITPMFSFVLYESSHVTSTNAMVRGHVGEIGTQLDGRVIEVTVDAGDRVSAGDVLIRLDDRQLRAEAQEAIATVTGLEREIEVEELAIEYERQRIEQQLEESAANLRAAEARSSMARIRADDAQRQHELRADLFSDGGAISNQQVRDAETDWREAEAFYQSSLADVSASTSAQDQARLTRQSIDIRERRIGVLEAELMRARARLSKVEADLQSAIIRAPQDGAIVRRIVQAGGSVEAGQPIIAMWLENEVWIEAWIDEQDIGKVALGDTAVVTLQSFPGVEFSGFVEKVGLATDFEMPEADVPQPRSTRMRGTPVVGVRIRLDAPPANLVPGLSASVAISSQEG